MKTLITVLTNLILGRAMGERNRAAGARFREENGKRPGVVTLRDGLQYEVLRQGDGPLPKFSSRVVVHYSGRLINGVEFDSSHSRGEPLTIGLLEVIYGWREGICMMPVGSHYDSSSPPSWPTTPRRWAC